MGRVLWVGIVVLALVAGCGSGGEQGLEIYVGIYDLTEAWVRDSGSQCPAQPTEIVSNVVDVRVDRNQFEARFTDRWNTMLGEIREDASFISSGNLGPDQTLRFNGAFVVAEEEFTVVGTLDDVRGPGCTRTWGVNGIRRPEAQ